MKRYQVNGNQTRRPGCAGPLWTIFLFDFCPYWTKLDRFGAFCYLDLSISTRLFPPIYLDLSTWTCLFGLVYLDLSILKRSIWTGLVGFVYLEPSIWTSLFKPVYLDPSIWICLGTRRFGPVYLDFGLVYLDPFIQTRLLGLVCQDQGTISIV